MVFSWSPVPSTNKTDRNYITDILLKVALNTIKQTDKHTGVDPLVLLLNLYISDGTYKASTNFQFQ